MIYDPGELAFWEKRNPGPIAKHIEIRSKHAAIRRQRQLETDYVLTRNGSKHVCETAREKDEEKMDAIRSDWNQLEDLHGQG